MSVLQFGVLVCDEKHGYQYWDATTLESLATSALAILTERWNDGYWYFDPDDDGLGNSEWAQERRREFAKAESLTKEQVNALPEDARRVVTSLRREHFLQIKRNADYRDWYERAKTVVDNQDTGVVTIGRNRFAHEVPKAWRLLDERSDHEYEGVSIELLHSALDDSH